MQGHQVHVVGVMNGEAWGKELPGLAAAPREGGGGREDTGKREMGELGEVGMGVNSERMKIAWRYEGLPRGRERGAWVSLMRSWFIYSENATRLFYSKHFQLARCL